MANVEFLIPPHSRQIEFMNASHKEQLFGGAKRGGKTVALCQKIVALSMAFPGNKGILIRQNLTDLKDSTLVTFKTVCPPELIASHHKNDRMITFVNGSYFTYRGVGDQDELEKVKGIDIGWIASDEPSEIDVQAYLMLLAQLNWKLPNGKRPPYMALLACNPEPGWVKVRFVDTKAPDRIFIPSLAKDNPGLPPGYVAYLRANFPEEWVRKYVEGSWEISEGMVFKEFDRATHVVSTLPSYSRLVHYSAIDHATTGVTSNIHMGILPATSDHFVDWEYYEKDKLLTEHAAHMLDRIAWYGANGYQYEYTLIDPSTGRRENQGNKELTSTIDLYSEAGVHAIPAWNAVGAGIERIKQLLHVNPSHVHPLTGKIGSPYLFVHDSCVNTIREFMELKRKIDANGTVTYSGTDHALDPVRYMVNSRPKPQAIAEGDMAALSSEARAIQRSHENWAKKFDKQIRVENEGQQDYFHYIGSGARGTR